MKKGTTFDDKLMWVVLHSCTVVSQESIWLFLWPRLIDEFALLQTFNDYPVPVDRSVAPLLQPMEGIITPHNNDVLTGTGKKVMHNHPGNRNYTTLINHNKVYMVHGNSDLKFML